MEQREIIDKILNDMWERPFAMMRNIKKIYDHLFPKK